MKQTFIGHDSDILHSVRDTDGDMKRNGVAH
nr:MAG TPA: hypothetical protein [Caudoviricetes sp.]